MVMQELSGMMELCNKANLFRINLLKVGIKSILNPPFSLISQLNPNWSINPIQKPLKSGKNFKIQMIPSLSMNTTMNLLMIHLKKWNKIILENTLDNSKIIREMELEDWLSMMMKIV